MTQNRTDWIDNDFTGQDDVFGGHSELAGRVQLLWEPSDDFSAYGSYAPAPVISGRQFRLCCFAPMFLTQGSNKLNDNYDRNTVWFDGGNNNPAKIKSFGVPP